jgi:DNA-binding GntR family transcriptional regulator
MMHIKKLTYSEQVVEYIKKCIINGELSPGDKVKEVEIAEKLSISRAPIREALQILSTDGLLTSEPQKVKRVTVLTSEQIINNYYTAGVLQGAAVSSMIRKFTPVDFHRLEEIVKEMDVIAHGGCSADHLPELDDEFHGILFSKTNNRLLINLAWRFSHGITKTLLFKYWKTLYTSKEFHARHKLIFEALKTGDPWTIEKQIRDHYMENGKRLSPFGADASHNDKIN